MVKQSIVIGFAAAALAASGGLRAAAAASSAEDQAAVKASLAGQWQLNTAQSEDARAKMREAMGGDRPGGRGGGGMGGGRGGRGGGGMGGGRGGWGRGGGRGGGGEGGMGGGMSRDGDRGGMSAMRSFFEPAERLTITQDGSEILIDDGVNPAVRLRPDAEATKTEGGASEIKARWNGSELVAETKLRNGAKLTTAYMLDAEKHQLDVTSRMEGGRLREPLTVRRVYDAAGKE
jgi:hypothetical protein